MKSFARTLLVFWLALLARLVLWRRKPSLVAITGSVGKTTTKELTARILAQRYRVRASEGNYNTEIGVPLTIIGARQPRRFAEWWDVTRQAAGLLFGGAEEYPEVLVLELAADKPGDLAHLTSFVRPDIAVITNVRNVHLEFYQGVNQIAEEKSWVVRRLKSSGTAILNADDSRTKAMASAVPGRALTYGFDEEATVSVTDVKQEPGGQRATLHYRERPGATPESFKLQTPLLGRHQLYAIMAAFAVGRVAEVNPEQIIEAIAQVSAPPGRMRIFKGRHRLTILDDSYNASPQATLAALETLYHLKPPHRAVLGDMKELGPAAAAGHRTVGEVAGKFLDELVVVGDEALLIAEAAKRAGMDPKKIHIASNGVEAATFVNTDKHGGTVLIKGSQAVYLEQAVKALLADPQDAKYLVQRLKESHHRAKAESLGRSSRS